ncbi:putative ribonuclease H-like domain-containing protein [Tanacetum coccineum]
MLGILSYYCQYYFTTAGSRLFLLRALLLSWNNVALIMRNKDGIDDLDIDDLHNNLKVFEADIKGSSGSSSNSLMHNSQGQASSSTYTDDLIRGHFSRECRALRNQGNQNEDAWYRSRDNTIRTVPVETSNALVVQDNALIVQDGLGYDWSYIAQDEPTEFALMAYTSNSSGSDTKANLEIVAYQLGLESVEVQLVVYQKIKAVYEEKITVLEFEVKDKSNAITKLKNKLDETLREKDDLKPKLEQFETSSKKLNKLINSLISSKDKTGLGCGDQLNENDSSGSKFDASVEMPKVESVRPSGVIIEDWVSDDEDIFQSNDLRATNKPSFKRIEFTNARNESVKPKQAEKPRITTQNPKGTKTSLLTIKNLMEVLLPLVEVLEVELKFNLFSVSQMCDKKNIVLFTKTECLVLSLDFKLLDESQVLLRVPRQSNMYSFDLKNVVPSGDLTCLFAKAIIYESKLWHRRLGHVNFKTMNKLVKVNLVRGLPSKIFNNDHTCVACQKEKQHKASCKAKLVSSISQPLQMFSWVFFLASKDETSGILKRFITEIENQLNHKVKVIRCDNGTEFKNREMNELCGLKGIKREFSVARTPQQNGVAERKNKTLIEAARTMLADSLLPTVFWAKVVNTACYVLNRVLVTKPCNKTPYELIIGRLPSISFMRPFGCPVTILNTLDPLGKFDGKAEEGFLIGYSVNIKAFKPVTAGNQTNKNTGPQEANGNIGLKKSVDAGQSKEKNVSTQQYIVFPLRSSIPSSYKSSDEKYKNDIVNDAAGESPVQKPASENEQALKNVLDKMMDQEKEATEQSDAVRKEFEAQCNKELLQGKSTRASNTNSFNTVSTLVNAASAPRTSNDAGPSFVPLGGSFPLDVNDLPDDPLMPDLEDTAEVQNTDIFGSAYDDDDLDSYNSPYADQVMGSKADFNNMEPSTVVSPIPTTKQEPTKIAQALDDESWVEAMQEELLQFKIQKVWTLVDLPYDKKAISTKIEAIRLFLAYASFMNFLVYQMDVKSAFLYGTIEEEVYVSQPPDDIIFGSTKKSLCTDFEQIMHKRFQMSSMGELTFFLGLQVKQKEDGIFISQDKYVGEILKKFGFSSIRTAITHMETNKDLTKDEDGDDVDVHLYRSMIGSLMYLTSSRLDIIFSVCACSRFQVQPKVSHLNAVKRIFKYLKGRPKLGLWYPKDSPFILEAFSDSDYVGASLDRKSTTTKIHVDNESSICVFKNHVYHSKTKHIEIRHHFIRDSYKKRLIEMVKIHTDNNVADLLTKAFDMRLSIRSGKTKKRVATTAAGLEAEQDSGNINRTQSMAALNQPHPQGEGSGSGPWPQETIGGAPAQTRSERVLEQPNEPPLSEGHTSGSGEGRMEHQFELTANVPIIPHDSPLSGGYTPGSDEGRLKLQELMTMCTKLSKQVLDLENAKDAQAVESSDDDLDEDDASKQDRSSDKTKPMIKDSNFDVLDAEQITTIGPSHVSIVDHISIARPEVNGQDELWMDELDWKLLKRKLHENYGVHTLFMDGKPMKINMLVEQKYPLIKDLLEQMLNLKLEAEEESTLEFELIKFIKSMLKE